MTRFYRFLLFLVLAVLFAPLALPGAALAATVATNTTTAAAIQAGPIINDVLGLLGAVLVALASVAIKKLATVAHMTGQSALRDAVEKVIDNAIAWAIQQLQAKTATIGTIPSHDAIVSQAMNYVLTSAPGWLKLAGIDISTPAGQQQVATWISARIGVALGVTDTAAAVNAAATAPALAKAA